MTGAASGNALPAFLGLAVDEVFPISYDISGIATGRDAIVKGTIPREPVERLSDEERMELILRQPLHSSS